MNNKTITPTIKVPAKYKEEEKKLRRELFELRLASKMGDAVTIEQLTTVRKNLADLYCKIINDEEMIIQEKELIGGIKK